MFDTHTQLIAPCGMNCSLCSGYLAGQSDVKSKGIRMPYCAGCRPRGKQCAYLKKHCALLINGKVTYCFECRDFPCERLQHLDKRYRTHFHMSPIENLEYIKKNGVDKFIAAQRRKWRCSSCSGTICCHNGLCFNCDLEKLKKKKKLYRWED